MKKILSLCLCLILLAFGAVPVLAASEVSMTLKADQQTLKPGDQVTISLDIQTEKACDAFGMLMVYDEKIFEVVNGKCSVSAFFKNFHPERGFAVSYVVASVPEGSVGQVTLRVRDNASMGETTFTGKPSVKEGGNSLECSINALTFQIIGDSTQETQQQTAQTQQTTETTLAQEPTQSVETSETEMIQTKPSQSGEQMNQSPEQEKDPTLLVAVIAVAVVAAVAVGGYLVLKKKQK